ncbi:sigma-54 interaction domain-containing protein [Maritalea porphyrae]|jgi:transcriptional regulator with PAS, ATPase and Fis domain|uniref:sigma-54 interaction domain-containing protein n=1 Tax=Maritalea porphyrae TaxID=880732 RepID=UPI0022B0774F|nr:sigma 54-interacting transcriptional regulator [Maritalea porphyrae]MCZ4273847.1 sigma 54-interacting transcriptional regulator [Maritalea porphyrae]
MKNDFGDIPFSPQMLQSLLREMGDGAIAIDALGHIIWINNNYHKMLGIPKGIDPRGRDIEELIPESRLKEVVRTGNSILIDIMNFDDQQFVVSRFPLKDSAGVVAGAIGFVLFDKVGPLAPLMKKFEILGKRLSLAEQKLAQARQAKYSVASIINRSPKIDKVKEQTRAVAQHDSPVLLRGETGTGKELFAHAIHNASARRSGPFVALNVAAIPEALLEAEFFGVAPGAYTGASDRQPEGKLALARHGTLFLDEVGDMPLALQAKLLRVLEEKEFEPVGSNIIQPVDVRIVAATSLDLESMVKKGTFRRDFYYRLNVLKIDIPPLRQRIEDVPVLCDYFLEEFAQRASEPLRLMADSGVQHLMRYDWPGNVRELRNAIERACVLSKAQVLGADAFEEILPADDVSSPSKAPYQEPGMDAADNLPLQIAQLERRAIGDALRICAGHKGKAAKRLGISRSQLYDKLKLYDLS